MLSAINSSYGQTYFRAKAKQTTNLASTNNKKVAAFTLPLPPLDDQQIMIKALDTGRAEAAELRALSNVIYDLERFGLRFVDSPRHADVLLVTGPLTRNLKAALEQAWDATPDPKWVVAVGDCAVDGGAFKGSYAVLGGTGLSVPVDLTIGGCPPSPARILAGLRALLQANAV